MNASNQIIAGLLCYGLSRLLGWPFVDRPFWWQLGATLLCAALVYFGTTSLVAGAINLSSGQSYRQVWVERFRWLLPYYLALGVVAYAFVFSYQYAGLVGVVIVLVPLLMLRFSQCSSRASREIRPSLMSVPRPAMLVAIITAPSCPAFSTMLASFSCCFAFRTACCTACLLVSILESVSLC